MWACQALGLEAMFWREVVQRGGDRRIADDRGG
jgi:hypothetical protein